MEVEREMKESKKFNVVLVVCRKDGEHHCLRYNYSMDDYIALVIIMHTSHTMNGAWGSVFIVIVHATCIQQHLVYSDSETSSYRQVHCSYKMKLHVNAVRLCQNVRWGGGL